MFDKLEALEERFQLVSEKISDPDIIADQESWRKYCKEHSDLTPIIDKYRELKSAKQTVADDKEMLEAGQDKEFEEMIRLEMAEAEETIERASEELKILLLPKTLMTKRMLLWKSEAVQAVTKPHFLLQTL